MGGKGESIGMLRRDIGIDLGTATVLVYVRGEGIVLNEPSVVAMDTSTRKILAVGEEAHRMLGRTPGNIVAVRPLKEGVIADYEVTEAMLRHFLKKALGKRRSLFRPRVMICIPSGATDVEKRAVLEAAVQVGASEAFLIEEPMAAAIGAGLDVAEPRGNMVVDIGGGTTDIAVISLGGIVISTSLRIAGSKMDEAIVKYVKSKYNLLIGEQTAEEVKKRIGSVMPKEIKRMEIRGRDLIQRLPRTIEITTQDVLEAIREEVEAIVKGVEGVLEKTPPELAADIIERGIILTGGGALLDGMDRLISQRTGVPAMVAEDPITCVARGTGKALEELDILRGGVIRGGKLH